MMNDRALYICTRLCFILVTSAWTSSGLQSEKSFTISKFWNGTDLPADQHVVISLKGSPDSNNITWKISAPFYDDPAPDGVPGEPFYQLWDYEVVEAFFLNDAKQYLEVEVGPHGQHIVLLLNGVRNEIRRSLPLNVSTSISGKTWTATAIIPGDYFPPIVTKFNAHAIHGIGASRQYWSLYPANSSLSEPDFHALEFFKSIDLASISPYQGRDVVSSIWQDALRGK